MTGAVFAATTAVISYAENVSPVWYIPGAVFVGFSALLLFNFFFWTWGRVMAKDTIFVIGNKASNAFIQELPVPMIEIRGEYKDVEVTFEENIGYNIGQILNVDASMSGGSISGSKNVAYAATKMPKFEADTQLSAVFSWLLFGTWESPQRSRLLEDGLKEKIEKIAVRCVLLAQQNQLSVWGEIYLWPPGSGVAKGWLEPHYWRNKILDTDAFLSGKTFIGEFTPACNGRPLDRGMTQLKVNKSQAESLRDEMLKNDANNLS